ncbi:unnamed protein product [Euphydryas editha]|uniref:Aquaporin n=1 Tax=Euphydryas editha TaxID=104508 RepID=A0AAU9TMU2_EUPED|nr:unnamed protein product [Euphydryas editha]
MRNRSEHLTLRKQKLRSVATCNTNAIWTLYVKVINYKGGPEFRSLEGAKWRVCTDPRSELVSVAAAEACGTALLVLLSCLPGCAAGAGDASLVQRALSGGLVVALIVQCFDHVSGAQLNPTVTLAAVLTQRISGLRAAVMSASQLAGGILGAVVLYLLASEAVHSCVTKPAIYISLYQALAIETLLGFCLAMANLGSWDARNRHLIDSWPLRIGTVVTALSLVAGDLTGASMNPIRSLAPALVSRDFKTLWVYCAGPLGGACAAAALYASAWRAPPDAPARGGSPPPAPAPARRLKPSLCLCS